MDWTTSPDAFIERCMLAIGGRVALHGARTVLMHIRRTLVNPSETVELEVLRAFGGRIRVVERHADGKTRVLIINGFAGCLIQDGQAGPLAALELETIKRRVRLYPRNFLAHAEEYDYTGPFPDRDADGESVWRLDLVSEEVRYGFDAAHFQCRFLEDSHLGERITYSDYAATDGILTARRERCWRNGQLSYEDVISYLAFNVPCDDADFLAS
ncbi:MAG: hypothetical protein SNJ67_13490 [Chloracidobacterium sp.]|uniref:Uncharacterized protein n=1 Tax=Chloracidobacterium validum TaxID=2821543 RepID=A0ABX8BCA7_9BACT|nr:hypothetical protein [Chloracidobacterium validum]QUW04569.1 hypothetical protein J8C06_12360 [Chloracidobacterium validum]